MTTIVIEVPDETPELIERFGPPIRLEIGGFFGILVPVRVITGSDRSEQAGDHQ